jgi:hypothetical protein
MPCLNNSVKTAFNGYNLLTMMILPRPSETQEQFSLRYQKAQLALDKIGVEHDHTMRLTDPGYSRFHNASDEAEHLQYMAQAEQDIAALEAKLATQPEGVEASAIPSSFGDLEGLDDLDVDADLEAMFGKPATAAGDERDAFKTDLSQFKANTTFK